MYSCESCVSPGPVAPGGGKGVGCRSPVGGPAWASAATVVASPPDTAAGPLGQYSARRRPRLAAPRGPPEPPPGVARRWSRGARDLQPGYPIAPCHARFRRPDGLRRARGVRIDRTAAIRLLRGYGSLDRALPKLAGTGHRLPVRNRRGARSREPGARLGWGTIHADCWVGRVDRLVHGRPPLSARGRP